MNKNTTEIVQPKNWAVPKGYANGVVAQGRQVFIAGQVGWNGQAKFESDDFVAQVEQALKNIVDVLAAAGGEPRHLVRACCSPTRIFPGAPRRASINRTSRSPES